MSDRLNRLARKTAQTRKASETPLGPKRGTRGSSDRSVPDGHIEARITQFGPVLRVRLQDQWYVLDLVKEEEFVKNQKLAIMGRPPDNPQ